MIALADVLSLGLFLLLGYVVYRVKFPKGFLPDTPDPERERLRRTGRRRVLPVPDDTEP